MATHLLVPLLAFLLGGCSRSQAGSVTPIQLEWNSFAETSGDSVSATAYQPPARLDAEVAPGYLLQLVSLEDEKLNGEYRIQADGKLELPYNVTVQTADQSLAQLKSSVRDAYRQFFRGTPDIEISVKEKKVWVKAQGQIDKPGTYLVEPLGGLDEVVSLAGGLQKSGDASGPRFATITGDRLSATIKLSDYYSGNNKSLVTGWRGGESVFFQNESASGSPFPAFDPKYIQVLGQVRAPGEYNFRDNANFFYYIVQAGGPTDRANVNKMLLVRAEEKGMKAYQLSLAELEDAPALKGGDVLFVQSDNPSDLEKNAGVIGSIGGFISSIATTILVGHDL